MSILDFVIHKGEKVHGWQLHRCIMAVLSLILVKEIMILVWSASTGGESSMSMSRGLRITCCR
jgi:hypothetical protein